ncbi:MAG: peptidase MA family metallohydrolase [Chloroflexota bacterium]
MKRAIYLFLLAICFIGLVSPLWAQADEPLVAATADYDFGQEMRFYLTAENAADIRSATLFFRAQEFPNAFSVNVPVMAGDSLALTHAVDLAQVRFAPFTAVTYWWVLATAQGDDIRVPELTFVYEDDQFAWRELNQSGVTVHWTGDDPALGQLALDIVTESLPRLRTLVAVPDDLLLRLYIYPSAADLRAALRLTGRDWVGAHAHPELGVILVTAVNPRTAATDLRQSIPHELLHHLLYQATGVYYDTLPVWFNEGLATLVETTPNPSYATVLETAVANQTILPFTDLCRTFPTAEMEAVQAYAQSASLVRYIQTTYGTHSLRDMIAAFADGADCEEATVRGVGQSLSDLSRDWLRSLQPRSPFVQFWVDNGLLFILLGVGFLITALLIISPSRTQQVEVIGKR